MTKIRLVEFNIFTRKFADAAQSFLAGITEIVQDNNLEAGFQEFQTGMGADIAGPAGDEYIYGGDLQV
jgi:hypothetical protein